MTIYVPNALQLPMDPLSPNPDKPLWDTLIALRNLTLNPVIATIRLRADDGSVVMFPLPSGGVSDHCDVTIEPQLMWPASFIPNNGFTPAQGATALAPQGWQGSMTIDCLRLTPMGRQVCDAEVLAFFLLAANDWTNGVNGPYKKDYGAPGLETKSLWRFAYAIPYFDDSTGDTHTVWSTGVEVTNREPFSVDARLVYTIAQTYAQKGHSYEIPFSIGPYQKKTFDLYLGNPAEGILGLKDVGYPEGLNSEGHLDILTNEPARLQPSAMVANRPYSFTVTEEEGW